MLVLSRRVGEKIVIGGEIALTVICVQGNRVKLGFTAPTDIPILRSEVLEARELARDEDSARPDQLKTNSNDDRWLERLELHA